MKMLRHDEDSNFLLLVAHGRTKWTVRGKPAVACLRISYPRRGNWSKYRSRL